MPLLAADWFEILAALIFFLITGLGQWIQKRQQEKRGLKPEPGPLGDGDPFGRSGEPPPLLTETPPPSARPLPMEDWEAQLRRLLDPASQAAPPTLPPTSSAPPRLGQGAHDEEGPSWETADAPSRPLVTLDRAGAAYQRGARLDDDTESRLAGVGQLSVAAQAIEQASALHDTVAARMRGVLANTEAPSSGRSLFRPRSAPPPAALAARNLLRHPATVRQAVIASILLQPPKAFDS